MLSLDVAKADVKVGAGVGGAVTSQRMELKVMENNGNKEAR